MSEPSEVPQGTPQFAEEIAAMEAATGMKWSIGVKRTTANDSQNVKGEAPLPPAQETCLMSEPMAYSDATLLRAIIGAEAINLALPKKGIKLVKKQDAKKRLIPLGVISDPAQDDTSTQGSSISTVDVSRGIYFTINPSHVDFFCEGLRKSHHAQDALNILKYTGGAATDAEGILQFHDYLTAIYTPSSRETTP